MAHLFAVLAGAAADQCIKAGLRYRAVGARSSADKPVSAQVAVGLDKASDLRLARGAASGTFRRFNGFSAAPLAATDEEDTTSLRTTTWLSVERCCIPQRAVSPSTCRGIVTLVLKDPL